MPIYLRIWIIFFISKPKVYWCRWPTRCRNGIVEEAGNKFLAFCRMIVYDNRFAFPIPSSLDGELIWADGCCGGNGNINAIASICHRTRRCGGCDLRASSKPSWSSPWRCRDERDQGTQRATNSPAEYGDGRAARQVSRSNMKWPLRRKRERERERGKCNV